VDGLIMDYQLTVPAILRRADALYGDREIVSRRPDKSLHRYTYRQMVERAKRLALALSNLGVQRGDRVATLAWNHHQHLEAYFGIPACGAVLHTLNLRLHPDDLCLHTLIVGGQAAPKSMIQGFQERHGLAVVHAWGMTETAPVGTVARLSGPLRDATVDVQFNCRAKQGQPAPFIEIRARSESGLVPWDGASMGELEVRDPWVASSYYDCPEGEDRFTDDGWFRTGDIVTIDPRGYVEVQDRAKDVIKSGGEWISSVALENRLMGHPSVAEAVIIAVPHAKWGERPLAVIVLKEGYEATAGDLIAFLERDFPRWWIPDGVEFVEAIPRSSVGKFLKSVLRERYRNHALAAIDNAPPD
jgi:fatty-acyl-CoA synthase